MAIAGITIQTTRNVALIVQPSGTSGVSLTVADAKKVKNEHTGEYEPRPALDVYLTPKERDELIQALKAASA